LYCIYATNGYSLLLYLTTECDTMSKSDCLRAMCLNMILCTQLCVSVELHSTWSVGNWLRHRRRTDTADNTSEQVAVSGTAWWTERRLVSTVYQVPFWPCFTIHFRPKCWTQQDIAAGYFTYLTHIDLENLQLAYLVVRLQCSEATVTLSGSGSGRIAEFTIRYIPNCKIYLTTLCLLIFSDKQCCRWPMRSTVQGVSFCC